MAASSINFAGVGIVTFCENWTIQAGESLLISFLGIICPIQIHKINTLVIGVILKFLKLRPGHTARTLLERSLSGGEKGQNFGNAHHCAQNGKQT